MVQKLRRLPLALAQATAYMDTQQIDFRTYLRKLEPNSKQANSKEPAATTYFGDTILTCCELSFRALSPLTARLLHLCAFLSNENIPEECSVAGKVPLTG